MLTITKYPIIIAHRGYKAKYPENTLAAFESAVDAGAQMIELDVRRTRDRQVVVIHDETLERTTDGSGPVKDQTLEKIKQLDAGSWFHPRFAGERIPTLEEVLDRMANRILINIEIKATEDKVHRLSDSIEQQVVDLIHRKNARSSVIMSSFESKILQNVNQIQNAPPIALISNRAADQTTLELCKKLSVFSWHPKFNIMDRKQVKMMHEANIKVFPYNVNSFKEFQKAIQMKADGVIMDDLQIASTGG